MRAGMVMRRFMVPSLLRTIIYMARYRAYVSPKAEVDFSPRLVLGRGVVISSFTKVKAIDGDVEIGANSSIGPGCFISSGTAGIRIGKDTMIAANTVIVANNHVYKRLDGCHVGTGAMVTAGSVVSGKVAPRMIVTGNPARAIFERR